jgi:hypothetical protein
MTDHSNDTIELALLAMRLILQRSVLDIDGAVVVRIENEQISIELRLHDLDQALDHAIALHNALANKPTTERN